MVLVDVEFVGAGGEYSRVAPVCLGTNCVIGVTRMTWSRIAWFARSSAVLSKSCFIIATKVLGISRPRVRLLTN
jgi:hypothetical protein